MLKNGTITSLMLLSLLFSCKKETVTTSQSGDGKTANIILPPPTGACQPNSIRFRWDSAYHFPGFNFFHKELEYQFQVQYEQSRPVSSKSLHANGDTLYNTFEYDAYGNLLFLRSYRYSAGILPFRYYKFVHGPGYSGISASSIAITSFARKNLAYEQIDACRLDFDAAGKLVYSDISSPFTGKTPLWYEYDGNGNLQTIYMQAGFTRWTFFQFGYNNSPKNPFSGNRLWKLLSGMYGPKVPTWVYYNKTDADFKTHPVVADYKYVTNPAGLPTSVTISGYHIENNVELPFLSRQQTIGSYPCIN